MANAYLQLAKTTRVPAVIRRACVFAQLGDSDKWKWLSGNEDEALDELANIYNDNVRTIYDELPLINVTSSTLTTVANQAYVTLPTNFRDSDLMGLSWNDDSDDMQGVELNRISPADGFSLPARGINAANTAQYPTYFWLDWENARINLAPTPYAAKAMKLTYRVKETLVVAADFKTTATTISAIPDAMAKMLAIAIAMDLCDRGKNRPRMVELSEMMENELEIWRDKLTSDFMSLRTNVFQNGGLPRTPDEAMI